MDKKLTGLMLIFFLAFSLFTSFMIFNKPLSRLTRAKEEFIASADTSLVFAWPLTAKADNQSSVMVSIFVRNFNNIPLPNKKVSLTTNLGTVTEIQPITDKAGKATFKLNSNTPGIAQLTAVVDNQIQLKQKVSVKFE
ncbi:MAG: Ig-like domain-containing protein [Microgenomates group bacterium]